jgi:hypothetical protein
MFAVPVLPLAIVIEIGELQQSPCTKQRINYFHLGALNDGTSRALHDLAG